MFGFVIFYLGQYKSKQFQAIIGICVLFFTFIFFKFFSLHLYNQIILYSYGKNLENLSNILPSYINFCFSTPIDYIFSNDLSEIYYDLFSRNSFNLFSFIFLLLIKIVCVRLFVKIKELKENLILHKLLRESSKNRQKLLITLKQFVNNNWMNLNVRQKYIELLLLDGQIEEAIAEARLTVREVDPYNFGVNFLLASGYFEAGLYNDCIQICNDYLKFSSYVFEFNELIKTCETLKGKT